MADHRRISKLLSLMLRHRPDEFGLNVDDYGFVPLDEIVEAVQQRYAEVTREDVCQLVEGAGQRRFEIRDETIRALYAHSFYVEMDGDPLDPPELLYMASEAPAAQKMTAEGIKPADRFYLHLSISREAAESRTRRFEAPCRDPNSSTATQMSHQQERALTGWTADTAESLHRVPDRVELQPDWTGDRRRPGSGRQRRDAC